MSDVAKAIALMEQALAALRGGTVAAPAYAAPAAAAPAGAPGQVDLTLKMPKMGKYPEWPLTAIAGQGPDGIRYLTWVVDKFGYDDNGNENPQYAEKNAKMRATAAYLIANGSGAPAPAPAPAPQYAPPAPQPQYAPPSGQYSPPVAEGIAAAGAQPTGEYYPAPASAPQQGMDEDIPF